MDLSRIEEFLNEEEIDDDGTIPDQKIITYSKEFKHPDLIHEYKNGNVINKNDLINILNYFHFMNKHIFICFKHISYDDYILVKVLPDPCINDTFKCYLPNKETIGQKYKSYNFLHIIINDGHSLIVAPSNLREKRGSSFICELPEEAYSITKRKWKRYECADLKVDMGQKGFLARGELLDFTPVDFRIKVKPVKSHSFHWFDPDQSSIIHIWNGEDIVFLGACKCSRVQDNLVDKTIVLTPLNKSDDKFDKKKIRNPRQQLIPSPMIIFRHPLINKKIQLEVANISTSGLLVYEDEEESLLMRGMLIPSMDIIFAGASSLKCSAKVIYRQEEDKKIKCGLAIMDMDINTYSRLTYTLFNARDPHTHVANKVNMEALWEFFFRSGFIYPSKYQSIESYREEFKRTYAKLYEKSPEIAKHFTYQKNGKIYGHISMVRAFERAWMIHHFAANGSKDTNAGFKVLMQIIYYMNDINRLPSAKIDNLFCFYQKSNKFPSRIFGGFAKELKNPKICSIDLFAYITYPTLSLNEGLSRGWVIQDCTNLDTLELKQFYESSSGGLYLDLFDLENDNPGNENLRSLYRGNDFKRDWKIYSLMNDGELFAVFILNISDLGFNLSGFLNCIQVIVTKPENLPWEILSNALDQLSGSYKTETVPILLYPYDYLINQNENSYDIRDYILWTFDARFVTNFIRYLNSNFRMKY